MRVSAQVGAGWYKTPLEAPHCNPQSPKTPAATPVQPKKTVSTKNMISGSMPSAKILAAPPAQLSKGSVSSNKVSGGAQSVKTSGAPPTQPSKGIVPKNKSTGAAQSTKTSVAPPAQPSKGSVPKSNFSGSKPAEHLKSRPKPTQDPGVPAVGAFRPPKKRVRFAATEEPQNVSGTDTAEGQDQEPPSKKRC